MNRKISRITGFAATASLMAAAGCSTCQSKFPRITSDPITVFAAPVVSGGSQGTCPGSYAGYVNYIKTVQQGWGWTPETNSISFTATDGSGRTNTKVEYVGKKGDSSCNQTTVTIPNPPYSAAYRFTIYFTNNVPTTNYPIILNGFNP
jgi:hypothetical protein